MELDFDRAVTGFSSQPFQLTWQQNGRPRRHIPDYFARSADGSGIVIDVRPDDRIEPRDAEAFSATEAACQEVGWEFRRTSGPAAVFAANLRWLAGYRHPRCMDDRRAAALLAALTEPAPLFQAAGDTGDLAAVLPVAYHLLWRQALRADLRSSLLGPEVNVWAAAGDVQ